MVAKTTLITKILCVTKVLTYRYISNGTIGYDAYLSGMVDVHVNESSRVRFYGWYHSCDCTVFCNFFVRLFSFNLC